MGKWKDRKCLGPEGIMELLAMLMLLPLDFLLQPNAIHEYLGISPSPLLSLSSFFPSPPSFPSSFFYFFLTMSTCYLYNFKSNVCVCDNNRLIVEKIFNLNLRQDYSCPPSPIYSPKEEKIWSWVTESATLPYAASVWAQKQLQIFVGAVTLNPF